MRNTLLSLVIIDHHKLFGKSINLTFTTSTSDYPKCNILYMHNGYTYMIWIDEINEKL